MQNVSLINSLWQPFYITNSVEKPKLPYNTPTDAALLFLKQLTTLIH